MATEPYVRPTLWATARNRLDPAAELRSWSVQLAEQLDVLEREPVVPNLFHLVSLVCRLRRVRPEWLDSRALQRGESWLSQVPRDWLLAALSEPALGAWRQIAANLADSFDAECDPEEQTRTARQLIEQLDDADLFCWYAQTLGFETGELNRQRAACQDFLFQQADKFVAASHYVQTVGQLLRPDLEQVDRGLARTADKYCLLLDACVEMEEELGFDWQSVLSPVERQEVFRAAVRIAVSRGVSDGSQARLDWLPADRSQRIAAAVPSAAMPAAVVWRSPDGALEATLTFDPLGLGGGEETAWLVLHHCDSSQTPATELAGQRVLLAGLAGIIDQRGQVAFGVGQLRQSGVREPWLEVGPADQRWVRVVEED